MPREEVDRAVALARKAFADGRAVPVRNVTYACPRPDGPPACCLIGAAVAEFKGRVLLPTGNEWFHVIAQDEMGLTSDEFYGLIEAWDERPTTKHGYAYQQGKALAAEVGARNRTDEEY